MFGLIFIQIVGFGQESIWTFFSIEFRYNKPVKTVISAVLLAAILSVIPEFSFAQSCKVESLGQDAIKITSTNDDMQLIVLGFNHRNYFALDKFSEMIEDAAKSSGNRVELTKKLDAIRAWHNNDMQTYYKNEAGPKFEQLQKLVQDNGVDFIGIESPYVTVGSRVPKIKASAELYTKLAKQAYGSQYAEGQLEKDILGMFGPNWYFTINNPKKLKAEGVESSLVEYRFVATYTALVQSLNKLNDSKTDQNKQSVDALVGILSITSAMNESVLKVAKLQLSPEMYQEVEKAASLRKKFEDDIKLRESWMLSSMKSRADHVGLLIVGREHIVNMLKTPEEFCKTKKSINLPSSSSQSVH